MTDQPIPSRSTIDDDRMLSAILNGDEAAYTRAAYAARYHADVAASRAAHPAGRAGYVPLVAPPLPNYTHLGHAIRAYVALLLIVAGFLVGITQHPWVAIPLVWAGCALAARLAIVHYRTGEKS